MYEVASSIEFQMTLLLFASLAGYLVAAHLKQPAVVGVILTGLLIGPSGLGWVAYSDFVRSLAHIGAVVLLFVIGLELRLSAISNLRNALIACFGVLLPWVGGYALAVAFGLEPAPAIFIGVALTATSVAITADVLREMGKLHSDASAAIIGAAVIDDVLALLALAIAQQAAMAELQPLRIGLMALLGMSFLVVGALGGKYVISRTITYIDASQLARRFPEFVFIYAMMMAFLFAVLSELAGLSAIVGAFVAGVSLEGVNLRISKHFKQGADYLRVIFGAVFFSSLGILAEITALTPRLLIFALALSCVAIATKLVGCGLSARVTGLGWRQSLIVGLGMSPRGEIAMVIALMALSHGVIEQPVYVTLVLMSLATTLVVPPILRHLLYEKEVTSR